MVEGLASIIVVWRFTGPRTMSESAERRAQRGVAISFWLLAPYIGIQAVRDLATHHLAAASALGIAATASSVVIMPALGITKQRLGRRLGSGATAGEGIQNLMCAAQAAAVLLGLAVVAIWPPDGPSIRSSLSALPHGPPGKAVRHGEEMTAASRFPRTGRTRS